MLRITEGLYRLERGGPANAYLIEGSSDLTLVDAGAPRAAPALIQEIKDNGFSIKDVARIIVTHAHPDHVGGISALQDVHPVKVYAHPKELPVLAGRRNIPTFRGFKGFFLNAADFFSPWRRFDTALPVEPGTPTRSRSSS